MFINYMAGKSIIQDQRFPKALFVQALPTPSAIHESPVQSLTGDLILVTFGMFGDADVHVEHPLFLRGKGKHGHLGYFFERRSLYAI
jgi:hypothetical protein